MKNNAAETVEPFGVPDTFVSGLAEVEDVGGGCYRFVFYARTQHFGREEWQVVAKLVAPADAVPAAITKAARAVGYCIAKHRLCEMRTH